MNLWVNENSRPTKNLSWDYIDLEPVIQTDAAREAAIDDDRWREPKVTHYKI